MNFLKNLCFSLFCFAALNCFADSNDPATKNKMISDLEIIKNAFEIKYAPAEWKKTFAGWTLESEINKSKNCILSSQDFSLKKYQRIVRDFFNSTRDYHVSVNFYTTEAAFLPFRIQGVNGNYYIISVLDQNFPFEIGDQVILFDHRNTDEVVAELKASELGNPDSETDQRYAEMILTNRIGSYGHNVPQGSVQLSILPKHSDQIINYDLEWEYFPEEIQNHMQISHESYSSGKPLGKHPFFYKKRSAPFHDQLIRTFQNLYGMNEDEAQERASFLGIKKSFLPDLGKVLWRAPRDNAFYAYAFKTPNGKTIGYVRIPHFIGTEKKAEDFESIIKFFNKNTDALVIDEMNNPGGYPFYMYALISMLTGQPLKNLKERISITQEDVLSVLSELAVLETIKSDKEAKDVLGSSIQGYPVNLDLVKSIVSYSHLIIEEWNKEKYFTDSHYIYGMEYIRQHPKTRYTKPILILVNNLSISCGDLFPAIMQDNNRATILGTKTSGAGGYVLSSSYANRFGIAEFSLTGSLAERKDGSPLENLGVVPDIVYQVTERDLQENYADYVQAILNAINAF